MERWRSKWGFMKRLFLQLKKALKIVARQNDDNRMAELNDRIALVYQDQGDYPQAVEYFSRTLELHRKTGNQVSLSRS